MNEQAMSLDLQTEIETYNRKREELRALKSLEGKFLLIKGSEIVDSFCCQEDALKDGYRRFGATSFLIKRLELEEPIYSIYNSSLPIVFGPITIDTYGS